MRYGLRIKIKIEVTGKKEHDTGMIVNLCCEAISPGIKTHLGKHGRFESCALIRDGYFKPFYYSVVTGNCSVIDRLVTESFLLTKALYLPSSMVRISTI